MNSVEWQGRRYWSKRYSHAQVEGTDSEPLPNFYIDRSLPASMSVDKEAQPDNGIVIDLSFLLRIIRYYAIIGIGLGFLGVVLLLQLGGGGDTSGEFISGIISIIILSFAVLSGPIIAAFVGYATAETSFGGIKQRSINSGIANGIGFAVFGIIVAAILWIGLTVVIGGGDNGASSGGGSGGPIELGNLITLIILMMIPNSFVGGAIAFFSMDEMQTHQGSHPSPADSTISDKPSESRINRSMIIGAAVVVGIIIISGGLASGIIPSLISDYNSNNEGGADGSTGITDTPESASQTDGEKDYILTVAYQEEWEGEITYYDENNNRYFTNGVTGEIESLD